MVIIILLRQNYLPPTLDFFADIVLIMKDDFKLGLEEDTLEAIRMIADYCFMMPNTNIFYEEIL